MNRELMAATVLRFVTLLAVSGCTIAVPSATLTGSVQKGTRCAI